MIWWFLLALSLPAFFIWVVVHEAAHAVVHKIQGGKVISFLPWPHKSKRTGRFLFGEIITGEKLSTICSLAPYIMDFVTFVGCFIAAFFVTNPYAWNILLLGMACPIINTLVGVQARYWSSRHADLSKVDWKYAIPFYYLLLGYIASITLVLTL